MRISREFRRSGKQSASKPAALMTMAAGKQALSCARKIVAGVIRRVESKADPDEEPMVVDIDDLVAVRSGIDFATDLICSSTSVLTNKSKDTFGVGGRSTATEVERRLAVERARELEAESDCRGAPQERAPLQQLTAMMNSAGDYGLEEIKRGVEPRTRRAVDQPTGKAKRARTTRAEHNPTPQKVKFPGTDVSWRQLLESQR